MRFKAHEIVRRAVEEGALRGWHRAHKYDDHPTPEVAADEIVNAIMGELCDVIDFSEPPSDEVP